MSNQHIIGSRYGDEGPIAFTVIPTFSILYFTINLLHVVDNLRGILVVLF